MGGTHSCWGRLVYGGHVMEQDKTLADYGAVSIASASPVRLRLENRNADTVRAVHGPVHAVLRDRHASNLCGADGWL